MRAPVGVRVATLVVDWVQVTRVTRLTLLTLLTRVTLLALLTRVTLLALRCLTQVSPTPTPRRPQPLLPPEVAGCCSFAGSPVRSTR